LAWDGWIYGGLCRAATEFAQGTNTEEDWRVAIGDAADGSRKEIRYRWVVWAFWAAQAHYYTGFRICGP